MNKSKLFFAVIFTATFFTNCVSAGMIVNAVKGYPISNFVMIHKNAKVGDSATYVTAGKEAVTKINSKLEGLIEIVQPLPGYAVEFHLFADSKGNIKKGTIANLDSNEKFDLKIAASDSEYGYVLSKKIIKLEKSTTVTTTSGKYTSNQALVVNMAGPVKQYIYLINSKVKFGYLKLAIFKMRNQDSAIKNLNPDDSNGFGLKEVMSSFVLKSTN